MNRTDTAPKHEVTHTGLVLLVDSLDFYWTLLVLLLSDIHELGQSNP